MTRIGIDATCWWNRRGFGRFTRQLLTSMLAEGRDHEFVLFVDQAPAAEMVQDNVDVVRASVRRSVSESAVASGSRSVSDIMSLRRSVAGQRLDVMYFPAVYSWYPTGGGAPSVVTFHDAIAEHYPGLVFPQLRQRMLWNAKIWLAKQSAAAITTVSESARTEIARYLGIDSGRIHVVLEAADPRFRRIEDPSARAALRRRLGLAPDARLLMFVGGLAPHKNLMRLIEAFAQARSQDSARDVQLVLVGDPEGDGFLSNHAELRERVDRDPDLRDNVRFTGFIEDDDLVTLYSDAWLLALPSLSEGFGLPAAEAIACGTPVIAARDGAVAEVAGKAGMYFDPLDTADMARVILDLASGAERVAELRAACAVRAGELSWSRAARETLDILQACAKASR